MQLVDHWCKYARLRRAFMNNAGITIGLVSSSQYHVVSMGLVHIPRVIYVKNAEPIY